MIALNKPINALILSLTNRRGPKRGNRPNFCPKFEFGHTRGTRGQKQSRNKIFSAHISPSLGIILRPIWLCTCTWIVSFGLDFGLGLGFRWLSDSATPC